MQAHFIAINYIDCTTDYREKFEHLFSSRAHAIDSMPGFIRMQVLKPSDDSGTYLVLSEWEKETDFKAWTGSAAFLEGHKRAFADLALAKEKGLEAPMKSRFQTYEVLAR